MPEPAETLELLTAAEVASIARVDVATVARWARVGRLPAVRVGRDWRFRRVDIEALLTPITPEEAAR